MITRARFFVFFSSTVLLIFSGITYAAVSASGYAKTSAMQINTDASLIVEGLDLTLPVGGSFEFNLQHGGGLLGGDDSPLSMTTQNNSTPGVTSYFFTADNANGGYTWSFLPQDFYVQTQNEVNAIDRHAGGGGYLEYDFLVSGAGTLNVNVDYENGIFATDAKGRVYSDASLSIALGGSSMQMVDRSFLDKYMQGDVSQTSSGSLQYSVFIDTTTAESLSYFPSGQVPVQLSFNTYAGSTIVSAVPEMESGLLLLMGAPAIFWKLRKTV